MIAAVHRLVCHAYVCHGEMGLHSEHVLFRNEINLLVPLLACCHDS